MVYRGHANEGRECLLEALALKGGSLATRAKALHFLGALAFTQADYAAPNSARIAAATATEPSPHAIPEALGEPFLIIRTATALGLALGAAAEEGDTQRARSLLARSVRLAERLGNAHRVAQAVEGVATFAAEAVGMVSTKDERGPSRVPPRLRSSF